MGYTNLLSSILLNQYKTQMNNNTTNTVNGQATEGLQSQNAIQQMVFQAVLGQMINSISSSMSSSMGTEMLLHGLGNTDAFSLNNSLSNLSNFNSTVRQAGQFLSKDDNKETDNNLTTLGIRASKYESNLNPAAISNTPGDYGGKSYGAWQFSSKTGSLNSFINSLKASNPDIYSRLTNAKAKDNNTFGRNFDAAWSSIATQDKDKFLNIQQNYVKKTFYDTAADTLKSRFGFDISGKSNALKESLWSTVVQHGVGGTRSIFSKLNLNNSDSNIIKDLYNERQKVNIYFRSSSPQVRQSVYNRFTREKQDMLNMLNGEFV